MASNLQRSYEDRIRSLLNSKNAKDVAKGQKLQATYQKLQDAKEVFHVVREGGSGTGELTYRGSPGNLYVEMKGDGSGYGYMPDVQKLGHEFEHGEQFLNGDLGFQLVNGKWQGYRDDLVDESAAFMAGFDAQSVGPDQGAFLQDLQRAANAGGQQAVIDRLSRSGPYAGRATTQVPITTRPDGTLPPTVYAVPRTN